MGTGQTLITIGAIMLLGTVILTKGKGINNSTEVLAKTNFGLEATSLATSTRSKAEYLAFDQTTLNQAISDPKQSNSWI